ncbi:hypothetical protein DH2020_035287 [Rehmannia glutinosa]|uniref:Uncharacterized protein n=1 Tax=Rehmannia glutinosa TaxID=99300 RepID=A0ABR0V818_REHGL
MCPPAQPPPPEIDLYWSDEQIISLLSEYTPGSHLPNNVLVDSSPFQYPPSNLPDNLASYMTQFSFYQLQYLYNFVSCFVWTVQSIKAKRECEVGISLLVADNKSNTSQQVFSELECFLRGDYLELNDLEDPESHSSSSRNSSCVSKLSDEDFDVSDFLRDLEEDENNYMQGQQSTLRYNFTSVRPNNVVLQPASSGSLLTGSVRTDVVEASRSSSTIHERSADIRLQENTTKRHNPESRSEGTSNAVPSREKKASAGRMKKLKIYLCFRPF